MTQMAPTTLSPSQIVIDRISEMQRSAPRLVIAIDGRGGAGKSSLARAIAAHIPGAKHFEYDWFHLPRAEVQADQRFDNNRLLQEVILPFRNGRVDFEFRRYNWGYLSGQPDGYADEPVRVQDCETIVLEGCYTLTPPLRELYDLKVWLDTGPEESLARGMRRDIEEYGLDPERVQAAWREWAAREHAALAREDRRRRADIVI